MSRGQLSCPRRTCCWPSFQRVACRVVACLPLVVAVGGWVAERGVSLCGGSTRACSSLLGLLRALPRTRPPSFAPPARRVASLFHHRPSSSPSSLPTLPFTSSSLPNNGSLLFPLDRRRRPRRRRRCQRPGYHQHPDRPRQCVTRPSVTGLPALPFLPSFASSATCPRGDSSHPGQALALPEPAEAQALLSVSAASLRPALFSSS